MKTIAIFATLLIGTFAPVPGASQNNACVPHMDSRVANLDGADHDSLYGIYKKLHLERPHAAFGEFLKRPDLINATLSAHDELMECNFWVGPIASLSFTPIRSATGVATTAAKILYKMARKPKYTNGLCFRGVQRNFLTCTSEMIGSARLLPNNSFKPNPLCGSA